MTYSLKNKNIVLCVCGGIAAYKSVELLRLLSKQEAVVKVLMTKNSLAFVGKLTFEALSGFKVCTSLFESSNDASINHIALADEADAVIIAPATANIVGKFASGIADDAVSTFLLAVTSPILVCPSMNTHMYENRAVQKNLDTLESNGCFIIEPASGQLACGVTGPGRLPEPDYILDRLLYTLAPKDLTGKKVLVTAGPTHESIDPVRFISNPSSGKMGYAVARAAELRGAEVIMVSGPTNLSDPEHINVIRIKTAGEMASAVFENMEHSDIIIKTAAVSDYRPVEPAKQKIKKSTDKMVLNLKKNQDILKELGKRKKNQVLVGFAAETEDLAKNAGKKLDEKNLDIIVGNIVGEPGSGFAADTNRVTLFYKNRKKESLAQMTKDAVADILLDRIVEIENLK